MCCTIRDPVKVCMQFLKVFMFPDSQTHHDEINCMHMSTIVISRKYCLNQDPTKKFIQVRYFFLQAMLKGFITDRFNTICGILVVHFIIWICARYVTRIHKQRKVGKTFSYMSTTRLHYGRQETRSVSSMHALHFWSVKKRLFLQIIWQRNADATIQHQMLSNRTFLCLFTKDFHAQISLIHNFTPQPTQASYY